MSTKLRPNKPLLFLLYGFPGSGKTHFARQLAEVLECAHVHSDRIRAELFERATHSEQENEIIKHLGEYMTEEFLGAGVSVVYDENADRMASRQVMRNMARAKKAEPVLIWLQTDFESAYNRLQGRDRRKADDRYSATYTPQSFKQSVGRMQNPQNEDYIVISGKHTFTTQKNMVMKKLIEKGLVSPLQPGTITKPGMVNLVPKGGRVDMSRRNIVIR